MTNADASTIRQCYRDAAGAFVDVLAQMRDGDWAKPGLGVWTVRDLAGHTSRALVTVENYLDPATIATNPALTDAVDYFLAGSGLADGDAIAERGRQAGRDLGNDPGATVAALADRVLALVDRSDDGALVTTA